MINLQTKKWKIDNINTVIFDKDGTFIDLHYFWGKMTELRALEIIKRYNLNKDTFDKICLDLGYDIKTQKMLSDGITALYSRSKIIEIFKEDLKKYNLILTTKDLEDIFDYVSEIFYQNIEKYTKPIDSAIDFIKKLYEKNIQMGVVTSDSIVSTKLTLKQFNLEKYFSVVIGRESSEFTKESGKPTLIALEEMKANPNNTIMIGDAPMDHISAKNANINKTILVSTGQIMLEDLKKISNFCVQSLKEISIK